MFTSLMLGSLRKTATQDPKITILKIMLEAFTRRSMTFQAKSSLIVLKYEYFRLTDLKFDFVLKPDILKSNHLKINLSNHPSK